MKTAAFVVWSIVIDFWSEINQSNLIAFHSTFLCCFSRFALITWVFLSWTRFSVRTAIMNWIMNSTLHRTALPIPVKSRLTCLRMSSSEGRRINLASLGRDLVHFSQGTFRLIARSRSRLSWENVNWHVVSICCCVCDALTRLCDAKGRPID